MTWSSESQIVINLLINDSRNEDQMLFNADAKMRLTFMLLA